MDNPDYWAEFKNSRASCEARRVDPPEYDSLKQEGDFYIKSGYITVWLPGLSKWVGVTALPIEGTKAWGWDQNIDKPTLTPSIKTSTKKPENPEDPPEKWKEIELWHGHLRAGRLESC